jgi:nicotinate-nucleotide--dimethylbenzimidazole phosphoribosyltransferase
MAPADVRRLLDDGEGLGRRLGRSGLIALEDAGIGNTTMAAALTASLVGPLPTPTVVGRAAPL